MNRQADRLEDDSQREDSSSGDARSADAGCCGGDPERRRVREGPGRWEKLLQEECSPQPMSILR